MDAIVTAGGRVAGEFAEKEGVTVKALLALNGKTLLQHTLDAVRGSRHVERICVVGPDEVRDQALGAGADLFAREVGTGIDNLLCGMAALDARGRVLCVASDLPFLRASHVDEVAERTPADAELSYVAFTRQEWDAAFPNSPATFIPLSDGQFTGGCVSVHDASALRRIEPLLQQAFAARKSSLGMARLVGLGVAVRLAAGALVWRRLGPSSETLIRMLESKLGCRCALVRGCSPHVAADVDHYDEWCYVRGLAQEAGRR